MEVQEDRPARELGAPERRAHPRHTVDCPVLITPLTSQGATQGRVVNMSLGGCLLEVERNFPIEARTRVELQIQLRGISFRIVGVTVCSRAEKRYAVRFLEMPQRRYAELAEVLGEVAAANEAKSAAVSPQNQPPTAIAADPGSAIRLSVASDDSVETKPAQAASDRRSHSRHAVDTSARLILVKTGACMHGRILNLSQGGCRLRTDEHFKLGIYVRVETEFYLHGLPFRLAGVSQAILDKNTIGVRFLDMSDRRREQLTELIAEIVEAKACGTDDGLAALPAMPVESASAGDGLT